MPDLSHLADLLAPVDTAHFLRHHWEREWLLVQGRAPDCYAPMLSVPDIDRLFRSTRLPAGLVTVVRDGERPTEMDTDTPSAQGADYVDPARIFTAFSQGATLVIEGAHHVIGRLNRFCAGLESDLQFRVQANIYVTPPGARGLRPHFDTHDVMVLQVSGTKHWRLYGESEVPLPVAQPDRPKQCPADADAEQRLTLKPGDLLYLPRGLVHDARCADAASIHIALGLKPDLRLALVGDLARVASERAYFRKALPLRHGSDGDGDDQGFAEAFKRELLALVGELDVPQLLDARHRAFVEGQLRDRAGLFSDLLLLGELSSTSVLVRRPALDCIVDRSETEITVRYGVHSISAPAHLDAAIRTILGTEPFVVGDLPGLLTEQGKLDLVREFVRTGFLGVSHV
jgi:hypothetical protein